MNKETELNLIRLAFDAREKAYVPYSGFAVGAALLAENGTIYQGCNIENAAFTPTICAERTAFFKAVYDGIRDFKAIAIVGGKKEVPRDQCELCAPCGVCRQVMREFCNPDTFRIILASNETDYQVYTLNELLPLGFGPENLR